MAARNPFLELPWITILRNSVTLVLIFLLGVNAVYTSFGAEFANFVEPIQSGKLSRLDVAALERGYYEDLVRVNNFNSELWKMYSKRPADWLAMRTGGLAYYTGDFRKKALKPSAALSNTFSRTTTNRWGMRDRDYEKKRPPGTYRIALLGASLEMGWGVEDHETFEHLLEDRLNREWAGEPFERYEVLNFAVAGYFPLQQMATVDIVLEFEPHAVLYTGHGLEMTRAGDYLATVVREDLPNPYPFLVDLAKQAGLDRDTDFTLARKKLAPYLRKLTRWMYDRIVAQCRERGILPLFAFVPQTNAVGLAGREIEASLELAKEAGFVTISVAGYLEGIDSANLRLAEWDAHPNALGHRRLADAYMGQFSEIKERLFRDTNPTGD